MEFPRTHTRKGGVGETSDFTFSLQFKKTKPWVTNANQQSRPLYHPHIHTQTQREVDCNAPPKLSFPHSSYIKSNEKDRLW